MNCRFEFFFALTLIALVSSISSLQAQTISAVAAQNDDVVRTVAFSGDTRGTNPTLPIGSLGTPVINDLGQTAFFAELNGPSIVGTGGRGDALFTEGTPNGLSQVFREDEFVPDSNDSQTLTGFQNVTNFSNSGQTVQNVGGRINNGIPPRLILRASSSEDLEVLVDTSGTVSGLSGTSITPPSGDNLKLNDRGEVSFSFDNSLFSDAGGQGFRVVASQNQILEATQVPGLSADVLLAEVNSFALNDSSQNLIGTTFSSLESGLLLEENGAFSLVASTGIDIEPGLRADRIFDATLNNRGDTIFNALVEGNGVTSSSDTAIVGNVGGSLEILAREGDAVQGTDFTFTDFGAISRLPALGGGGDITFVSTLSGGGGFADGLFVVDENGTVDLIAQEGESLPGLSDGEVISSFSPPAINENGQVAFQAFVRGDDVTFDNDRVIFAQDTDGILQLIAREGDVLNVSEDPTSPDFRQIERLNFFGGSGDGDGVSSGFNNLGQVAFRAEFGFQSGVFVSSLVSSVPEPSSVPALLMVSSFYLTIRRRRRPSN